MAHLKSEINPIDLEFATIICRHFRGTIPTKEDIDRVVEKAKELAAVMKEVDDKLTAEEKEVLRPFLYKWRRVSDYVSGLPRVIARAGESFDRVRGILEAVCPEVVRR